MSRPKRRYSGDDRHWGPFTWSRRSDDVSWTPIGVILDSGAAAGKDDRPLAHLRVYCGHWGTLLVEMPNFIKPYREHHEGSYVAGGGENNAYSYDEQFSREYGAYLTDGALHYHYGPHTHASNTSKNGVWFLPWLALRHVRFSLYDLDGAEFWTQRDDDKSLPPGFARFEEQRTFTELVPKRRFQVVDYDGEVLTAETHIEEREWRQGTGAWAWLSWFCKPLIRRSLAIRFDKETGPEKGSWKGGTLGTGIDMLPGELHAEAWARFCQQEHRSKYRTFRVQDAGESAPANG